MPTVNVIPIPGPDNPDRIYVTLIPAIDSRIIVVRPGSSGARLPRFWAAWFSKELRSLDTRETCHIDTSSRFIRVSTTGSFGQALALATTAASKLHALPKGVLIPKAAHDTFSQVEERRWIIRDSIVTYPGGTEDPHAAAAQYEQAAQEMLARFAALATQVKLPTGFRLQADLYGGNGAVTDQTYVLLTLSRRRQRGSANLPLIRDVAPLVELHYTLAATAPV